MLNLICIVCPIGCSLMVDDSAGTETEFSVTGNRCQRGSIYAYEEIRSPKRTVTATCRISNAPFTAEDDYSRPIRRLPVKTSAPCPREKIFELLDDIYKKEISLPVKRGDTIIDNWMGLGINIISTRTMEN